MIVNRSFLVKCRFCNEDFECIATFVKGVWLLSANCSECFALNVGRISV